jgi:methyl coenzyme M reductase beta subunit
MLRNQNYYPLLVSRVPLVAKENYHEVIISGRRETNPLITAYERTDTVRMSGTYSMFMQETFVGKSTTQIGRNLNQDLVGGDAEVFEKWAQAVASACGQVIEAAEDYKTSNEDVGATIVLPILIVPDGTLWVADYSNDGQLVGAAKKVDSCIVYLGKEASALPFATNYWFSHLQVFTKTNFVAYLKKFGHGENYWDTLFCETKLNPAFLEFQTKYA